MNLSERRNLFVGVFEAMSHKMRLSICCISLSVCPNVTAGERLKELSWSLALEIVSSVCRHNSGFIKIIQK
jgi:hypothetical protein